MPTIGDLSAPAVSGSAGSTAGAGAAAGAGAKQLLKNVDNESFLVRLLADGMDDHAILHRLYGDQLSGKSFPNAAEIVWTVRAEPAGEDTVKLEVISSGYWLDALERTKNYESAAYPDAA